MESSRLTGRDRLEEPLTGRLIDRLGLRGLDGWMMFATIGLVLASVLTLGAASEKPIAGAPDLLPQRQAIYALIGIVGMVLLARFDYSRFRDLRTGLYALLCISIIATFVFGFAARGSTQAIELPLFSFQPAEPGKLLLILALAGFVLDGTRAGSETKRTLRYLAIGMVPTALVLLQDLGTSLVYAAITIAIMLAAGVRWSHLGAIGASAVALVAFVLILMPAAGVPLLKEYQQERLTSFVSPASDPRGVGYQQNQAKVAAGAGGLTGRGDQATQSTLGFVPERHTDFVFSVVAERYGFAGAVLVLALFALLLWRALRLMSLSKDSYGKLVAAGIACAILFQVFVSVGMNLGIMPITGIPLPLMSYGGSAVISTLLMVGVLQSIHIRSHAGQRGPWVG